MFHLPRLKKLLGGWNTCIETVLYMVTWKWYVFAIQWRIAQDLNYFQDNIIISDRHEAQITDFGLSRILDVKGYTTMTMRNVRHAAPELRPNADVDMLTVRPTTQSDIYSLGILFLQVRQY